MAIRTDLFAHQRRLFDLAKDKTFFAIFHEPGLGKTLSAAAIIDHRKQRIPSYRAIYVCPTTLIDSVAANIQQHTDLSCETLTGTRAQRSRKLFNKADVYIINYEGVRVMCDELIRRQFSLSVFDESHKCKDVNSLQSKACFRLSQAVQHKLIMTGTPVLNTPLDCFGQIRLLHLGIFGSSYYRFRARYSIMGGYMNKKIVKYINMPDFNSRIAGCSDIRKKEECLDLPDKLFQTVHVELPEEQQKIYRDLRVAFLAEMNGQQINAPIMLTRLLRFSQITAGFCKTAAGEELAFKHNPKQEWLVEWLQENQQKTVVFCRFIKEIRDLEKRLKDKGIGYVTMMGETVDRAGVVAKFNADPQCQVFIGQIDTAGTGLNLQTASYVVFLSNTYSYGSRRQAEDRIHRIGQQHNCVYIDVVCANTIDTQLLKLLKRKESLSEAVMNINVGELI